MMMLLSFIIQHLSTPVLGSYGNWKLITNNSQGSPEGQINVILHKIQVTISDIKIVLFKELILIT
jgi:hypothetical protein